MHTIYCVTITLCLFFCFFLFSFSQCVSISFKRDHSISHFVLFFPAFEVLVLIIIVVVVGQQSTGGPRRAPSTTAVAAVGNVMVEAAAVGVVGAVGAGEAYEVPLDGLGVPETERFNSNDSSAPGYFLPTRGFFCYQISFILIFCFFYIYYHFSLTSMFVSLLFVVFF